MLTVILALPTTPRARLAMQRKHAPEKPAVHSVSPKTFRGSNQVGARAVHDRNLAHQGHKAPDRLEGLPPNVDGTLRTSPQRPTYQLVPVVA